MVHDTIIALASGAGRAGVAVLRLSGPKSAEVLRLISRKKLPEPRIATLFSLYDAQGVEADKALVLLFIAPNSFTGEDVVELHIHGGRANLEKVMQICLDTGLCRLAMPGEFSRQAFDNGKMDLTEAEGLCDLIEAETEAQRKQALRLMTGELGELSKAWRLSLIECLAQLEAYIDFPDEDIPGGLIQTVLLNITDLKQNLSKHLESAKQAQRVREGFRVVLLGAPNSGKSTLLNALVKRDASIVSAIAGTTRDIVEVSLILDGQLVWIADTAGLHESDNDIEREGMRRAILRAEEADLRIGLVSGESEIAATFGLLREGDILAWSKTDLWSPKLQGRIEKAGIAQIMIAAKSGSGLDDMQRMLSEVIGHESREFEAAPLTRERHKVAVESAIDAIDTILQNPSAPAELTCENIRMAARNLAAISGEIGVEDVLDKVFSSFCIGK
ncbi:MAG: trmE [Hyphomonadaceae bacterium]|nr:MAG: trmE [Hyphomonadaceae bacterium]